MKKILFSVLFISLFSLAHTQSFTDAIAYNDYIIEQQNLVGADILAFVDKFNDSDMTKAAILPSLERLLKTAKTSLATVEKIEPFEGDSQLKPAAVKLFQFYVKVIDSDYRTMVDMLYGGELTDDVSSKLNTLVEKIQTDEASIDLNFATAQAAFAEKHNIELMTNELQEEFGKD